MVIEREQLLRHLKRIHCNGSIPEVAFSGPFRATAISFSQDLLMVTAGLPGTEPLPREIGVSLDRIVKGFGCAKGQYVEVEIEADKLTFNFSNGRLCLQTFPADLVHTRMEEGFVQKALAYVPDDAWQSLDRSLVADVLQAIRAISPYEGAVALRTTPDKTTFIVGDDKLQTLEFDTGDVKSDQPYALWFKAELLRGVLEELARADGEIAFTGPNAVLGVRIGDEVQYVVSPLEETRGPRGSIPHGEPKAWNSVGT